MAFKSLTDWIMDEAQHFSNLCTNKEYGVVEHLDACDVRRGGREGEGRERERGKGREGEGEGGGRQVGEECEG